MANNKTGIVVSNKADKTITVKIDARKSHPIYKKHYTVSKKFLVHDEKNQAGVGDKVEITQTRAISKNKSWTLVGITSKARELGK